MEKERNSQERDIKKIVMREFAVNSQACSKLFDRFNEFEVNNFQNLEKWLNENRYAYRVEWGK